MSGLDEQDVVPCECKKFDFWFICDNKIMIMGYLHSNTWMEINRTRAVSKWMEYQGLSKEDFLNKIASFHCSDCNRTIKKGCATFERLYRNVRTRWDK